ncbi:MAG: hypothetical protein ABF683_07285 [Sporolactobacillus sp.]
MFKRRLKVNHPQPSKQELRRSQLLFCLLLAGFLLIGGVYVWEHLAPAQTSSKASDQSVTIAGERPADDSSLSGAASESSAASSKSSSSAAYVPVDAKAVKARATQFISEYFAYDRTNPYQHLADVQSITDAGFYKELSESQTNDTHVPSYGFRKISKVVVQTVSENDAVESVKASMNVQTFDSKNKPTGSRTETVSVDLKQENGALKVAYFASSLEE